MTVKILDTENPTASPSDDGPTQFSDNNFLKLDKPIRVSAYLSSGDTVVIEGKSLESLDWQVLHTFEESGAADVYVSQYWRASRSVDGTAGEATVYAENPYDGKMVLVEDAAS